MIIGKTRTFDNHSIRFMIEDKVVRINAMDLLEVGGESASEIREKGLCIVIANFLKETGYSETNCIFESDEVGILEVWMDSDFAVKFAKTISTKLSKWCNTRYQELLDLAINTDLRLDTENILNPKRFNLELDYEDTPGGFVQTFTYNIDPITFCVSEKGVMVNVIQMMNIFQRGCYEWYTKESTKKLLIACTNRGICSLSIVHPSHPDEPATGVWIDLMLAEDLATWYEEGNVLKLWLQNRVNEIKFFKKVADKENYTKASQNPMFLSHNCIMSRV